MASLWMLAASLSFACMGACVKLGAGHLNAGELTFWRGAVALIAIGGYVILRGHSVRTPLVSTHLHRGVSGITALVLSFLGIASLPIATAFTLTYTSPLWLATLVAWQAHERPRPSIWTALGLGLAGVALLLKPSLENASWRGAAFSLGAGALAALAYLNVRKLGEAGEPEWRTVFWFSALCGACGAPFAITHFVSGSWTLRDTLISLGVGGFGLLGQLAMTRAYRLGKTLVAASLSYTTVVFAALLGAGIWQDKLDPLSALGIVAIISSGILVSYFSHKPQDAAAGDA